MTDGTPIKEYTGNGVTRDFSFPYKFFDATHVTVYRKVISTSIVSTVSPTEYTVAGAGAEEGGTFSFLVAPTSDHFITILLDNVPLSQEADYVTGEGFPADAHESQQDKVIMILQQMREELKRCPKVDPGSGTTGEGYLATIQQAVVDTQTAQTAAELAEDGAVTAQGAAETAQGLAEDARDSAQSSAIEAAAYAAEVSLNTFEATATAGQTAITVTGFVLAQSLDNVEVFINGVKKQKSTLTRTSDTIVTLNSALSEGEKIEVRSASFNASSAQEAVAAAAIASSASIAAEAAQLAAEEAAASVDYTKDNDGTFIANSDDRVASQKATKTYVDTVAGTKATKGSNSDITSLSGLTTPLSISQGGTGQDTAQEAIDALTAVSGATNEHVLTKDTATGNAKFKSLPASGISSVGSAGDVLLHANDTSKATASGKIKEIISPLSGTLRIKFDFTYGGGSSIAVRIYRNGVAVGTAWSLNSTQTKTEDISGWSIGDLIQIYTDTTGSTVSNFRVYGATPIGFLTTLA